MLTRTETTAPAVENWLAQFERALAAADADVLSSLFHADSYWRDVLALTWRIETVGGADAIVSELNAHAARARPSGFKIDPRRTAPRRVTRAGTAAIEAIFCFETAEGRGSGVVRLIPDAEEGNTLKAWTLLTALDEIKGHEEQRRPVAAPGQGLLARFPRPELARPPERRRRICRPRPRRAGGRRRTGRAVDRRAARAIAARHADRRPRAAHRRQLAQALPRADAAQPGARQPPALHAVSAELAGLHPEGQARQLVRGLCGQHGAQLLDRHRVRRRQLRRSRAVAGRSWCAAPTARDAPCARATSSWRPASAAFPSLPDIPSLRNFAGTVLHSSQYQDGEAWKGKRALVIGTGNSGHDIAQDLHVERREGHAGAAQPDPDRQRRAERAAPLRALRRRAAAGGLRPDHDVDAARARPEDATSCSPSRRSASTRTCSTSSSASGSSSTSARTAPAGSSSISTRGGGYYFNVGCSDLIVEGEIGLAQFSDIADSPPREHACARAKRSPPT